MFVDTRTLGPVSPSPAIGCQPPALCSRALSASVHSFLIAHLPQIQKVRPAVRMVGVVSEFFVEIKNPRMETDFLSTSASKLLQRDSQRVSSDLST